MKKKKSMHECADKYRWRKKLSKVMRLSFFISFILVFNLLANDGDAQNKKIQVNLQNNTIREAIAEIERQSDYNFLYNSKIVNLDEMISISYSGESAYELMSKLFESTDIRFTIIDNRVILTSKEKLSEVAMMVQESHTVNGVVTDHTGEPLPGVNVFDKANPQTGVITGVDGSFSIKLGSKDAILAFSFIGFEDQELNVAGRNEIRITLVEEVTGLEEIVVVGYGTQKKVNVTGAVATVKTEELVNRPTSNTMAALQGVVPGVVVTRSSGVPGQEDFNIQIRGKTSVNNEPVLVLIDGVEGSMERIQPDDVESISVLKDAAAASIYGSRSAGGVILITTKKGKEGRITVNYNGLYTINSPARMPERIPMGEIAEMQNLSRTNAGLAANWTPEQIEKINDPNTWYEIDPTNPNKWRWYGDFNYIDLMLEETAPQQNHNVSISGGESKLNFRLSTSYYEKKGLLTYGDDDNRRYSARLNLNSDINEYLRLETDVSFYRNSYENPAFGNMEGSYSHFYKIYTHRGLYPLYTPLGDITGYAAQLTSGTKEFTEDRYQANGRLYLQNLVKGLKVSVIGGIRNDVNGQFKYMRKSPVIGADASTIIGWNNSNDEVYRRSVGAVKKDFQFLVDYDLSLGRHTFHALGGYSFESYRYVGWDAKANGLVNSNLFSFDWADIDSYRATDNLQTNAYQAVFGRLNYDFGGKYLFEANIRYDGSSKLPPSKRYRIFPSFSGAWRVSEEEWFNLSFIDQAKIRASWGQLGNADVLANYDYIAMLGSNTNLILGGNQTQYIQQNKLASEEKSWETIETSNLGVDLGFLNNRLHFSGDYFVKYNKDMLAQVTYPTVIGIDVPSFNAGELKTWGWEMSLSWRQKVRDFSYYVSFNLSDSENELVEYYGKNVIKAGVNRLIEGMPINSIYGYKTDGYFDTDQEVNDHVFQNSVTGVGDVKYVNMNEDDIISTGKQSIDDHGDLVYLGNTNPRYNYGINFGGEYKGFDFSIFLQGVGKRSFYASTDDIMPFAYSWVNPYSIHRDYYTEDNKDAMFPRLYERGFHNYQVSDKWVQNGAYLRLKNIQVGYTIPQTISQKAGIQKLRVYVTGQDLWESTKTMDIYDPEMPSQSGYRYPFTRGMAMGLNITF
jgi:TonB-linked SusC/RagA family outer membrane protein